VVPKHHLLKEKGLQVPKKERQQVTMSKYQRVHWTSAISEYLANQNDQNKNADSLFCQSLVPILSSLPTKNNRRAKFEIQKLLYDIEFSDD